MNYNLEAINAEDFEVAMRKRGKYDFCTSVTVEEHVCDKALVTEWSR